MRARNREALYTLSRTFERCGGKRARRGGDAVGASTLETMDKPLDPAASEAAARTDASSAEAPDQVVTVSGTLGAGCLDANAIAVKNLGDDEASAAPVAAGAKKKRRAGDERGICPYAAGAAAAAPAVKLGKKRKASAAADSSADASVSVVDTAAARKAEPVPKQEDGRAAGCAADAALANGGAALGLKAKAGKKRKAGMEGGAAQAGSSVSGWRTAGPPKSALAIARGSGAAAAPEDPDPAAGREVLLHVPASAPKAAKAMKSAVARKQAAAGQAPASAAGERTGGMPNGLRAVPAVCPAAEAASAATPASATPAAGVHIVAQRAAAATAPAAGKRAGKAVPAASAEAAASAKKHVKFALSRNLAHAFGAPVPPADVRTPPSSQPKGSALKCMGAAHLSPGGSAPGRLGGRGAGKGVAGAGQSRLGGRAASAVRRLAARSPKAIPRAQAAQFF